jgi:hypothetical protein
LSLELTPLHTKAAAGAIVCQIRFLQIVSSPFRNTFRE